MFIQFKMEQVEEKRKFMIFFLCKSRGELEQGAVIEKGL